MVQYNLESKSAFMNIGGISPVPANQDFSMQILVSLGIVIVLFVMLVYLIYLRRNRIKAEEWLEQNKSILFNSALGLKSEEEILEALVKSQKMLEKMNNHQVQLSEQNKNKNWNDDDDDDKGKPLLNGDKGSDKSGAKKRAGSGIHSDGSDDDKQGSVGSNKQTAPQTSKIFSNDP